MGIKDETLGKILYFIKFFGLCRIEFLRYIVFDEDYLVPTFLIRIFFLFLLYLTLKKYEMMTVSLEKHQT